jgi:DNA adenine methylase
MSRQLGDVDDSRLAPPLKWPGGKRWLVRRLQQIWSAHSQRRLVEPFAGGLSVALGLMPRRALLNDKAPELVNFYRAVQRGLVIPPSTPMVPDRGLYLARRDRLNALLPTLGDEPNLEAAALLYYLNKTGFNGLHRVNSSGRFNVGFGEHKAINYVRDFSSYADVMSQWRFTTEDFERVEREPDDFIYLDPPYDGGFDEYAKERFDWQDQVRLVEWAKAHRGPVVISNAATERVVDLYQGLFDIEFIDAPRSISCDGDRRRAKEVLASKNISGRAVRDEL